MGKVLNMRCRGRIHPDEAERPMIGELGEARKNFACHRDGLLDALDAPLRERIECLLQEREQVAALEKEDAYVRGTRMGAKMAAALLKKP